ARRRVGDSLGLRLLGLQVLLVRVCREPRREVRELGGGLVDLSLLRGARRVAGKCRRHGRRGERAEGERGDAGSRGCSKAIHGLSFSNGWPRARLSAPSWGVVRRSAGSRSQTPKREAGGLTHYSANGRESVTREQGRVRCRRPPEAAPG